MNYITKLKHYFLQHAPHAWQDFSISGQAFAFNCITDDVLINVAHYINANLSETIQLENKKHRLISKYAIQYSSLDDLMIFLKYLLGRDYQDTQVDSSLYGWQFTYYIDNHLHCKDTLCVANALFSKNAKRSACVYTLATIRLYGGKYYCWSGL